MQLVQKMGSVKEEKTMPSHVSPEFGGSIGDSLVFRADARFLESMTCSRFLRATQSCSLVFLG